MTYKLKLDIFEGPLDLLLYLIKKNELDICKISITEVTAQYLQYVEMMKMLDLDVVGDFLVMAATLIQIKSRSLLPPDPSQQEEEEEDPREELVRRLLEYKKFKEVAEELRNKEIKRQDLFTRSVDEEITKELKEESKEVYFEASLFDLISALTQVLKNVPKEVFYEVVKEEHTVDQKIHDLLHLLLEEPRVMLMDLFKKCRSRIEAIVTFMAILELIRLREIVVVQRQAFGDIEVIRNKENILPKTIHRQEEGESSPGSELPQEDKKDFPREESSESDDSEDSI